MFPCVKILVLLSLILLKLSWSGELEELVEFALKNNPRIRSFDGIKLSTSYKRSFVESLPNPRLAFALKNLDTERYFPNKENPMSSFGISLSQTYVLPEKRRREAQILSEKETEILLRKEKYTKEVVKKIKVLYWEFAYTLQMERLLRDIEREVSSLLKITEERYRFGKALISDLILLKTQLLKVQEDLAQAKRLRSTSLERIYAIAGGRLELKGEELKVPEFLEGFEPERNVDIRLAKQEAQALRAEVERAKVEHYPDVSLSVEYEIRPDNPNLITLMVGIPLPIWRKRREDMLLLEKSELLSSKLLEVEETRLRVEGDFRSLEESYKVMKEQLSVVEKEIEEKRKEIEALLLAYRYERRELGDVLTAYRTLWSLELDRIRLLKELNQTVAEAEALQ